MDLNLEQKKAIKHDKGPLLIIAGAGTGKTRVITSRILELINSGKAEPTEILALTFTEKAANEMITRLDIEMPLSYEELCVKTFHAFSDQVLRECGMEMGLDPGYKILSQVEQWFFFKKYLFKFELDYYRPLGNPNRFIYAILNHFSKLKDELISPKAYLEYAEKLSSDEEEKIYEIARCYEKYQQLLMEKNFLDFSDLSFYVSELFEKRKSCLKNYQERFKYILVDEFQDTNYAQFKLVLSLAQAHKNICVVGDDDQSIYKWRGASLSNILQFEKHFPDCEKVVLTENYRSSKSILDSAYSLIQNNNPDRLEVKLGLSKRLKCHSKIEEAVCVHHFPDFLEESVFVAEQIKSLHNKDGANYSDFAILIRANQQAHPFIDELKQLAIPFQVRNPKGLFALDEIKDLLALVRVIANPYDDISLLRVLRMDVFKISMHEILDLLKESSEKLYSSLKKEANALPGLQSGLQTVAKILSELIEFSKKQTVGMIINEFLHKSGHLEYLVKNDHFEELDNINEFAKQIAKFEKENEDKTVLDFVNYLNLLEEASAVFATEDFSDRDSVQILTVHGAKGLEFDYVFVVNAVNQRFPGTNRAEPFKIPEELTNEIYPQGDHHLQEERRLFYVAMTRAKKRLFICHSDQYEGSKQWKPSPFVTEVLSGGAAREIKHEATDDAFKRLKSFKEPDQPIFDLPGFKGNKLSFTQFDTFKTCPLKYNYQYLMKVPTAPFHAANFGSSVHKTLNEFYRVLKSGKKVNLKLLTDLYEKYWISAGYESKAHEETRKKQGLKILADFYEGNKDPWIVPTYLEKNFNLKIGDFWLSGRIDRIDKLPDGNYEVIDYKTGRLKENVALDKDLQLSIYALACRDVFKIPVSKLSLYFLEDNEKLTTVRTEQQLENLPNEIERLIQEMQKSKFMPTPGFHCQFCDFRIICPAV